MSRLRDVRLYLITDRRLSRGRSEVEVVEAAISGGVDMVQYREKELPDPEFKARALDILRVTREHDVPLIINDRVGIAIEIDADGVHLGQKDMECGKARQVLGREKTIGVSVADPKQALKAVEAGADYLGVGPVYQTDTKQIAYPRGTGLIREVRALVSIPIFAIGGINLGNVAEVISAGASAAAVISAILSTEEISSICRRFIAEIEKSIIPETP